MEIKNFQGVLTVIGAFLLHIICGTVYAFGVINPYLSSYLQFRAIYNGTDLSHTEYISSFNYMAYGFAPFLSSIVANRIGIKKTIIIGFIATIIGIFLTYFTIKIHYLFACLTFGIINGIGICFIYMISVVLCQQHFPERSGLVTGIALIGDSSGAFVYNPLLTFYVNPNNEKPNVTIDNVKYFKNDDILDRVPHLFLVMGGLATFFGLIGILLLRDFYQKQIKINYRQYESSEETFLNHHNSECRTVRRKFEIKEIWSQLKRVAKNSRFIILYIDLFVFAMNTYIASNNWKEYGQIYILNDQIFGYLSFLVGFSLIGGRIGLGLLVDQFRFKIIIISSLFILFLVSAALPAFQYIKPVSLRILYFMVMIGVQFFIMGGFFTIISIPVKELFGEEFFAINYGLLFSPYLINMFLSQAIFEALIKWKGMIAIWEYLAGSVLLLSFLNLAYRQY